MEKLAQKRSLMDKIREMTDLGGIASEKFFNPEFEQIMNELRDETDDPVRSIITGQKIGKADIETDGRALKEIIKSAKSLFARREYMSCVAELGRFHHRMNDVANTLNSFRGNVNKVHHKFLFHGLDPETEKYLKEEMRTRFAHLRTEIVKEAGIMNFLHNITDTRARALAAWEKRYPKQVNKLKQETKRLIDRSESLLDSTISHLKEMARARATRRVDDYIVSSSKIINAYNEYNKLFKDYYATQIKGFLEKFEPTSSETKESEPKAEVKTEIKAEPKAEPKAEIKTETPQETVKSPSISEQMKTPIEESKKVTPQPKVVVREIAEPTKSIQTKPSSIKSSVQPSILPSVKLPELQDPELRKLVQQETKTKLEQKPELVPEPKAESKAVPAGAVPFREGEFGKLPLKPPAKKTEAYVNFLNSLESLANENPIIIKKYIYKYAAMIEKKDPETSSKLIEIAKSICGD